MIYEEQLASVIALDLINEIDKRFDELPSILPGDVIVQYNIINNDTIKFVITGKIGDTLGNPELTIGFKNIKLDIEAGTLEYLVYNKLILLLNYIRNI